MSAVCPDCRCEVSPLFETLDDYRKRMIALLGKPPGERNLDDGLVQIRCLACWTEAVFCLPHVFRRELTDVEVARERERVVASGFWESSHRLFVKNLYTGRTGYLMAIADTDLAAPTVQVLKIDVGRVGIDCQERYSSLESMIEAGWVGD